jgi:hypothetical protein
MVGFSPHWRNLGGESKESTGRINILAYDKKYGSQEAFERDDPRRFGVFLNFVVAMGDHAGKSISVHCTLQDLVIDNLGQFWSWESYADRDSQSAITRALGSAGFEFGDGVHAKWMDEVNEYGEVMATRFPYLLLPTPTAAEMAEAKIDGDPLPGITRELVLMGIDKIIVSGKPVFCQIETNASGERIVWNSIQRLAPELLPAVTATYMGNERAVKAVERAMLARQQDKALPIEGATTGMPYYEKRDDEQQAIPFMPDEVAQPEPETEEANAAKVAMWSHVKRLYNSADQEKRGSMATILFDGGINLKAKQTLLDVPYSQAGYIYHQIVEDAGEDGLPITEEEQAAIVAVFEVVAEIVTEAEPPDLLE